eukprot:767058-Hanusia_phi.AAC.10
MSEMCAMEEVTCVSSKIRKSDWGRPAETGCSAWKEVVASMIHFSAIPWGSRTRGMALEKTRMQAESMSWSSSSRTFQRKRSKSSKSTSCMSSGLLLLHRPRPEGEAEDAAVGHKGGDAASLHRYLADLLLLVLVRADPVGAVVPQELDRVAPHPDHVPEPQAVGHEPKLLLHLNVQVLLLVLQLLLPLPDLVRQRYDRVLLRPQLGVLPVDARKSRGVAVHGQDGPAQQLPHVVVGVPVAARREIIMLHLVRARKRLRVDQRFEQLESFSAGE